MQSFILDRHTDPSNPTMKVTQDDKIPIYDSKADAEADLANIEEGGIVATKDTGATEKVVDVVQDGNMNPVTSNGVFDYVTLDYSSIQTITASNFTATKHTRMNYLLCTNSNHTVTVNGTTVSIVDNLPDGQWVVVANVDLFPGDVVVFSIQGGRLQLIDYKA